MMAAFGMPVSLDVLCKLVQLPPLQFLDLIRKCESLGWIHENTDGSYGLSNVLPDDARSRIEKNNSTDKLAMVVESITANDLVDKIPESALINILQKAEPQTIDLKKRNSLGHRGPPQRRPRYRQKACKANRLSIAVD